MQLGGRDLQRVLAAPLEAGHWRALAGAVRAYPPRDVLPNLRHYLTGGGHYPVDCRLRTPMGAATVHLVRPDDRATVNEIFARGDYRLPAGARVVVDVGANIGVAALFFLTRDPAIRVHCVEPDPRNLERLRRTLAPYEGRWVLHEVAAALHDGEAEFFIEPTGRYGGLVREWKDESMTVPTRVLNAILDEVLATEGRLDVLKVDTEGTEPELVGAVRPDLLDHLSLVVYETDESEPLHTDRFHHAFGTQTNRLTRRAAA